MKKIFILTVMVLSLLLSMFIAASANEDIKIYVNDELLSCDVAPFIKDGRTMVPMRKIFEALGARVEWEGLSQTITATKENIRLVMQINSSVMDNNGIVELLDVAPVIVDGSTFVPVRAVSQGLNATVEWFALTQTVYIDSAKTYDEEYNSFLNFYMQATVPAGYIHHGNVASDAIIYTDICVQGMVSDVQVIGNDVYLIMNNHYSEGEKVAIYIGKTEATSPERMTELFKNTNISVGGTYLGVTDAFGSPVVSMHNVSVFESDSWYDITDLTQHTAALPVETVTLYDHENQAHVIPKAEENDYLAAGWTYEMKVVMYAPDGRTLSVLNSEVEAYQNVGWYLYPVTTMYAADGRTIVVGKNEVYAYKNVGWYETYYEAQASGSSSYTYDYGYGADYNNQPNSGGQAVYRTPYGERYHFDPDCGGENSYQTTLQKAKNAGLKPCKKCAW